MAATNPKKFISKVTFSSKTSDVTHGKELSSHERYFVLEIAQEILMHWHDLKTKGQARKYTNLITKDQVLPLKILENSASEKRINVAACLAIRECRGKIKVEGRRKNF